MRHHQAAHPALRSPWKTVLPGLACITLISGCAFPRKDHTAMPDVSVIRVMQGHDGRPVAHVPDCAPLLEPSQYHNPNNARPAIAFGCATYNNLAAHIARPGDLISPRPYRGQHPDSAALAVERYRLNQVEPLRETSSTDAVQ